MIAIGKILNVASVLLLVVSLAAVITGLLDLFIKTSWEGQFSGFYLFGVGLFFTPIILVPFRKGERWAWYTTLVAAGVALVGQMILIYNALNDGWTIEKNNNKIIFTKNHQGENKYYLENYLSTFMKEYLNVKPK